MWINRSIFLITLTAILIAAPPVRAEEPTDTLRARVDEFLGALNDPELTKETQREAQRERMWDIIRRTIFFEGVARLAVGKDWSKFTDAEKRAFTDAFADFLKRIVENPKLTETIRAEDEYKPEVAIFIRKPWADEEGWSHFVQVHPDGTGDYVGYKPDELDHSSRWIMRTDDQQALGIALPATCDPEGYTAEKKKGALKSIQGKDSMRFHVRTGYLSKPACARMNETIGKIGRR